MIIIRRAGRYSRGAFAGTDGKKGQAGGSFVFLSSRGWLIAVRNTLNGLLLETLFLSGRSLTPEKNVNFHSARKDIRRSIFLFYRKKKREES